MSTGTFAYVAGIGLTITGFLYMTNIHDARHAIASALVSIGVGLFAASRFWRW